MPTWEGVRLKVNRFIRTKFADLRRKKLTVTNFTIISNNCWGGTIYESYNLPKQSPTVGLFIMPQDYIKFLKNLRGYLSHQLKFINPQNSRWVEAKSKDNRFGQYPIGVLTDGNDEIEIFFLHYHDEQEALEKWERRCQRINWDRLLVKFNDQNGCTENEIAEFDNLPYKHKVCFTVKDYPKYKSVIKINVPKKHLYIRASYEPFGKNRYLDLTELINKL